MGGNASKDTQKPPVPLQSWVLRLILVLFAVQLVWLVWQLREDLSELGRRMWTRTWGGVVRQEDPFYRWLLELHRGIPPEATYLFLDNYEAGKEIEARYHLFPRRHLLLLPNSPPSRLFHTLRHYQVSYLVVRDATQPPGPGLQAALDLGAARHLTFPGSGLVYQVDPARITGGFYD